MLKKLPNPPRVMEIFTGMSGQAWRMTLELLRGIANRFRCMSLPQHTAVVDDKAVSRAASQVVVLPATNSRSRLKRPARLQRKLHPAPITYLMQLSGTAMEIAVDRPTSRPQGSFGPFSPPRKLMFPEIRESVHSAQVLHTNGWPVLTRKNA